jgi:hypothetical protein
MMMLFEDLRLALRQICSAFGLSGTALTVIPLLVLGVALNIAALSTVAHMRHERHSNHKQTALRSAARTELKVMRTMLASTLKKISGSQRKQCVEQQWVMDRQRKDKEYRVEAGASAAPGSGGGCDVEIVGSHRMKTAIAFVQC